MPVRRLLLLTPIALTLVLVILLARSLPSAPEARALPPAGIDLFTVNAEVDIISRLGVETIDLSGTVTVARGDPQVIEGVEVVDALVIDLDLAGNSITGPVTLALSEDIQSTGELRSLQAPPTQFPAEISFDVFAVAEVPGAGGAFGITLHNEDVLHLSPLDPIDTWPPVGVKFILEPIYLVDNDNDGPADEDTADDDNDLLVDEDGPNDDRCFLDPTPPCVPGPFCGSNLSDTDCDGEQGEDPRLDECPEAANGVVTQCDQDGDGLIDEDPSCIPLMNPFGTHTPAAVCVRDISLVIAGVGTPTPTNTPCPPEVCTPTPSNTPTPTGTPTSLPTTPSPTATGALPTATPSPTPTSGRPEDPSFSVAAGGPSGLRPADLLRYGLQPVAAFGNDNFGNAWPVDVMPFAAVQNTGGATEETGEPLDSPGGGCFVGSFTMGSTVWYRYTAPVSGTLVIDTAGSNFDTGLAVYTGIGVTTLTQIACNDDGGCSPGEGCPLQAKVTINTTAGTTYRIQAGGLAGNTGDLALTVIPASSVAGSGQLLGIQCSSLGLTNDGCDPGDGDQDDIDALSYGIDNQPGPAAIAFSVASGSTGMAGSPVRQQATCVPSQAAADEFLTSFAGSHVLFLDGDGLAGGCPTATTLGLTEAPTSDDLDALVGQPTTYVDTNVDGVLDKPVFFSLKTGSPTLISNGRSGADVMWTIGLFPGVYASSSTLGLQAGDDLDALCVVDVGGGTPSYNPALDSIRFSLAPGSPTLASLGASAADVMGPGPVVLNEAATLGLQDSDNLDAMKCFTLGPVTPTPPPTATPTQAGLVGDANCNGTVNPIDATIVLQFVASLLGSLPCQSLADANQNGSVNAIDATLILQYSAGLLSQLPP